MGVIGGAVAATAVLKIVANTRNAQKDLGPRGLGGTLRRLIPSAKTAALGIAGIGVVGAGIGIKLARDFLQAGDALDKMSRRTGVAVEDLSAMKFAAEQSGATLDDFANGLRRQAGFVQDAQLGLSTATDALDQLGLSVTDLEGKSPDALFNLFADAIANLEDPILQAALAQDVFGRGGTALLPLLKEGSEGIHALTEEARATGNIMSTEAAEGAAKFNDTLNTVKNVISGALLQAFNGILPVIQSLLDLFNEHAVPVIRDVIVPLFRVALATALEHIKTVWETTLKPTLDALFEFFSVTIVPAVEGIVTLFQDNWDKIEPIIAGVFTLISGTLDVALGAIRGIITTITGLISGDWDQAWEGVKTIFNTVWGAIKDRVQAVLDIVFGIFDLFGIDLKGMFRDLWEAVKGGFETAWVGFTSVVRGGVNGLLTIFEGLANGVVGAINTIINAWNGLEFRFPGVKLPGPIPDIPGFTVGTPNIPTLGRVALPRLQRGGVVTAPTVALLGEAGPEAVVPLGARGFGSLTLIQHNDFSGATIGVDDLEQTIEDVTIRGINAGRIRATEDAA